MKLILTAVIIGCFVPLEAKPTFVKVFPVPIIVPKVDVLGIFGDLLGLKAALVGQTLKTHGDLLQTIGGLKSGIASSLTNPLHGASSIVTPVYAPAESFAQYPAAAAPAPAPPPVPSTSYGTPYRYR